MKLFRDGLRTNLAKISLDQTPFSWLDESTISGAQAWRNTLQAFLDHIPSPQNAGYAHRLRSAGYDHDATVSEIFVHEVLRRCGYSIELEPTTPRGSRPEFLVSASSFKAYIEATTDTGIARHNKESEVFETLMSQVSTRITSTGFGIFVHQRLRGHGNPSPKQFVNAWMCGLVSSITQQNVRDLKTSALYRCLFTFTLSQKQAGGLNLRYGPLQMRSNT